MLLKSFERPSRDVRAQASFLGAAFLAAGFFSASALGAASFFGAAAFLGAASLAGAALASAAGAASAFGAASFFGAAFLRSEEHTSELQSLMRISYAVFCLKKKNKTQVH